MEMTQLERRTSFYWIALSCVAVLCCVLAVLPIPLDREISRAEQDRLRAGLQSALARLSEGFNSGIQAACAARCSLPIRKWTNWVEIEHTRRDSQRGASRRNILNSSAR